MVLVKPVLILRLSPCTAL